MKNVIAFFLVLFAMLTFQPLAFGQEAHAPVPNATIYPGEIIQERMLGEGPPVSTLTSDMIDSRSRLVGRIARRTLFANRPVAQSWIGDPQAITNGSLVQLVYQQTAITITATGQALQAASIGDTIRVRNVESGIVVSGVVASDGTVKVGG